METPEEFMEIWRSVFEDFVRLHPYHAEKVVDWYPSGQHQITLKMCDGSKWTYEWTINSFSPVRPSRFEEDFTDKSWQIDFSTRLLNKLRRRGVNQEWLAEQTGISSVTISKYVNAKAMPSAANITRIARALNCHVSELYESSDMML